jgi:hypothetical protein
MCERWSTRREGREGLLEQGGEYKECKGKVDTRVRDFCDAF